MRNKRGRQHRHNRQCLSVRAVALARPVFAAGGVVVGRSVRSFRVTARVSCVRCFRLAARVGGVARGGGLHLHMIGAGRLRSRGLSAHRGSTHARVGHRHMHEERCQQMRQQRQSHDEPTGGRATHATRLPAQANGNKTLAGLTCAAWGLNAGWYSQPCSASASPPPASA